MDGYSMSDVVFFFVRFNFPFRMWLEKNGAECYKIYIISSKTDLFAIFADAKISCTSAMQENKHAYFFVLHSVCIIFAP